MADAQQLLRKLLSPDFAMSLGVTTSPHAIRRAILDAEVTRDLRVAIRGGLITESDLERSVDELSAAFVKGERFPFEAALATIAVVLETRKTDFTDRFLLDLARLNNLVEFAFAPQVAALARQKWARLPRTRSRYEAMDVTDGLKFTYQFRVGSMHRKSRRGISFETLETA